MRNVNLHLRVMEGVGRNRGYLGCAGFLTGKRCDRRSHRQLDLRYVYRGSSPNYVEVDNKVLVNQLVANSCNLAPRNLWMRSCELRGDAARRLAKYLEFANYSILNDPIAVEDVSVNPGQ